MAYDDRKTEQQRASLNIRDEEKKRLYKEAVKEGIKEFLNEQYIRLGKWSLHTIVALLAAATCYFILWMNGWKHAG